MDELHQMDCPKMPWMIDFHSTQDGKIPKNQLASAYAQDHLTYLTNLDLKSETAPCRLTTVVCTISDECRNSATLIKMMSEGMNVAKINMAFYTREECLKVLQDIRNAVDRYTEKMGLVYPLAIAMDIRGCNMRTGNLQNPYDKFVTLVTGEFLQITVDADYENNCTEKIIYINKPQLQKVLRKDDQIFLDGDKIVLQVVRSADSKSKFVDCVIKNGGKLYNKVLVNAPTCPICADTITEEDKEDIKFATENGFDAIFISNVDLFDAVYKVRLTIGKSGGNGMKIKLYSKIESMRSINNIKHIIEVSDGLVIRRSSLAAEIPAEKQFLVQKSIIGMCLKAGKPVMCSTELYQSDSIRVTRAEATDVVNSIIDGIDGIILGKETARHENGLCSINTLNKICLEAEAAIYQKQLFDSLIQTNLLEHIYIVAISSVQASIKCNAAAIIVLTTSGRTAKVMSQYRPRCPIIAVTRFQQVSRMMNLYRGVKPLLYLRPALASCRKDADERFQLGITYGKSNGWIKEGSTLILVQGYIPDAGHTNTIRIVYASDIDTDIKLEKEDPC